MRNSTKELIHVPELVMWLRHNAHNQGMSDAEYKSIARHILNMPAGAREKFLDTLEMLAKESPHRSPLCGTFVKGATYRSLDGRKWVVIKREGWEQVGDRIVVREVEGYPWQTTIQSDLIVVQEEVLDLPPRLTMHEKTPRKPCKGIYEGGEFCVVDGTTIHSLDARLTLSFE